MLLLYVQIHRHRGRIDSLTALVGALVCLMVGSGFCFSRGLLFDAGVSFVGGFDRYLREVGLEGVLEFF